MKKIEVPNAKYYGDIIQNHKGMWVTWLKDENGKDITRLEWTTKKGLLTKLKELGVK